MTKRLLLLVLLLVAVPAFGAGKDVGTWIYDTTNDAGDATKLLELVVTDDAGVAWGTSVGPGYTPTLLVRLANDTTLVTTLTGTWKETPNKTALFSIGTSAALVPAAGVQKVAYEAVLRLTKTTVNGLVASNSAGLPFLFYVERWP